MINNIKDAERLAYKYFKDKVDKGGNPYMEHLKYVSDNCKSENAKIVGMLHDIIEDTDITISELESELHINLVESIQRLSRPRDIKYNKYIDNIIKSNDLVAIEVKMYDLKHNMDITRLKEIRQVDIDRLNKYNKAYKKIKYKYDMLKHNEYRNNLIDILIKNFIEDNEDNREWLNNRTNEELEDLKIQMDFIKSHKH